MRRVLVWLGWLLVSVGLAQGGASPDLSRPPDVVVVIQALPDGSHPISWTFRTRLPHNTVQERIQRFTQWSERPVAGVEIGDDTLAANPKPNERFTVASFAASGLVNLKEGTVNLTPLARTFADLPVVHVYVLLPNKTEYAGYFQYGTPHLQMWTDAQPTVWRTVLNIYTPDPTVLEIPLKRPKPQPQAATPSAPAARPPLGGLILLILLIALLVGAGIFWATSKLLKRQTGASPVQPETEL
ncbi:MAG: hypothetical protein WHS44_01915 [Fimbriimonadales bacterium]|nr:MAG: hypothetical protein KatS3mg018_0529 [Fimbriimonadales bacterium]